MRWCSSRGSSRCDATRIRDRERGQGWALLGYGPLGNPFTSEAVGNYYDQYGVVLAVATAGALLVVVAFTAARLIAPSRPGVGDKLVTYESGIDPVGEAWSQGQIRYYIYGFLFVIFDVEAVFLFPWAVVYVDIGIEAVVAMTVFLLVLSVGLLYAYRKGVLRWV